MIDVNVPEGFHFAPKDYEFINYLRRRKNNQTQPCNRVIELDLYGNVKHPSDLFSDRKEIYFFTTLKKCENVDSRFQRKAGCGTWKGQNSNPVYDPNDRRRVIGENKLFSFEARGVPKRFRYIMHEYSLPQKENYPDVFCKIRIEQTKKSRSNGLYDDEEVVQHSVARSNVSYDDEEDVQRRVPIECSQSRYQYASDLTRDQVNTVVGDGKKRVRDNGYEEDFHEQSKRMCSAQCDLVNTKLPSDSESQS